MPNPRAQRPLSLQAVTEDIRSLAQPAQAMLDMLAGAAKGSVSATVGIPGDIESLGRGIASAFRAPSGQRLDAFATGMEQPTVLPTTENVSAKLPAVVPTTAPLSRQHSAGYGQTMGEFIPTPGSGRVVQGGLNAIKSIPAAVQHGAQEFAKASAMGVPHVVKPKGGNFLTGNVEQSVVPFKSERIAGETPAQRVVRHEQLLNDPSVPPESRATVERHLNEERQRAAIDKWVEGNLTNYIKREMATPEDPLRQLAEQGITHNQELVQRAAQRNAGDVWDTRSAEELAQRRKNAGFPQEGLAQSELAKGWEALSDEAIYPYKSGDIQSAMNSGVRIKETNTNLNIELERLNKDFDEWLRSKPDLDEKAIVALNKMQPDDKAQLIGNTTFMPALREAQQAEATRSSSHALIGERNPWITKLDPETRVYSGSAWDLGFDHIIDVLREDLTAGRIRPEQLSKVSMEQAVRRTYEYDQELAKKMAEARVAAREGLPVHKEYPEGYRWVELNKPGAFASESEAMGHSVRGYEPPKDHPDWIEGSGDRGSLGYGHGGWEAIKSGNAKVYSLVDPKGNPHVTVEARKQIEQSSPGHWLNQLPPEEQERILNSGIKPADAPEYQDWLASRPYSITQVKGKQNAAPNEEYLPYVQDFVRSSKMPVERDLHHTGLIEIDPESDLAKKLTERGFDVPRYALQDELTKLLRQSEVGSYKNPNAEETYINPEHPDWREPEGMKRGGKVSISDNPDTMMIDVEDKRYDKGGEIKATPRSEGWGMAADLIKAIEGASKEQFGLKNPATEEIANFLMIPELARTLERKAYGQPITNIGKANVPLIPEDTSGALEAVAPLTGLARKGAKAVGKAAASEIEKAMFGESRVGALNAMTPQVMSVYKPHTPKKPDPEVGSRYKTEHVGNLAPKKEFNIEKEQGSSLMSNPWDLTSRGEKVLEVSDVPLVNPIITEGGHDFARDLGHIDANIGGASGEQIAQRMQDRVNDAYFANMLEKGTGRVFTMPSTMDITASNYSTMPVDIVMDLMSQANLKSKDIDKITNDIKTFMFEGEKGKFKNIAPVNTPEFSKQLREGGKGFSAGDLRKGVMDRLSKSEYQKMIGFNIEDVYGAIHDPTLKGYPKGYVGNTMIETVPFADLQKASHGSYDTANAGKYAGAMPSMPLELATPDLFEYFEKMYLANPKYQKLTPNQLRTMIVNTIEKRGSVISQPINQRVVDNVMRYKEGLKQGHFDPKDYNAVMDFMRRTGGYKDGGEVHGLSTNDLLFLQSQQDIGKMRPQAQREYITNMGGKELRQRMELKRANGGEITADDLTIEERPL